MRFDAYPWMQMHAVVLCMESVITRLVCVCASQDFRGVLALSMREQIRSGLVCMMESHVEAIFGYK
jgi:hypothetical protein